MQLILDLFIETPLVPYQKWEFKKKVESFNGKNVNLKTILNYQDQTSNTSKPMFMSLSAYTNYYHHHHTYDCV